MATKPPKKDSGRSGGSPPLGNGREDDLSDEALGLLSRGRGPESQGGYASEDYGAIEQGAYGDEDFDASYQRDGLPAAVDPDAKTTMKWVSGAEREGPGRGLRGGEWVREEPLEPLDELARKLIAEETAERRRDDDAIEGDIVDVLSATLGDRLPDLRVTVTRGEATIEGIARDRTTEVEAYRLAARVPGVIDVVGGLRVA